jgi:hypothetical protein
MWMPVCYTASLTQAHKTTSAMYLAVYTVQNATESDIKKIS